VLPFICLGAESYFFISQPLQRFSAHLHRWLT
jgi:hypothetical protein